MNNKGNTKTTSNLVALLLRNTRLLVGDLTVLEVLAVAPALEVDVVATIVGLQRSQA